MPISSVGTTISHRGRERGVTLIELLIVVAIVALFVGIGTPAISSGIQTLRLNGAANSIVGVVNSGLTRAERRQQVVEVLISAKDNAIWLRTPDAAQFRCFNMPDGVRIVHVLPLEDGENPDVPREFFLYPGGSTPALGVDIVNRKGAERIVRVDPITGVPQITNPADAKLSDS
jgi:prepilin-type N-terminal cleavage/methylation domain-containing protein